MDKTEVEQINHLLAGLVCYSLVDKVCSISRLILKEDEASFSVEYLKDSWLKNIKETGHIPDVTNHKHIPPTRKGVKDVSDVQLEETSQRSGGSRAHHALHFRLKEPCPVRNLVQGCLGTPLPRMVPPNFVSSSKSSQIFGNSPVISYQYRAKKVSMAILLYFIETN